MRKVKGKDLKVGDVIRYESLNLNVKVREHEPVLSKELSEAIFMVLDKDEVDLITLQS